MSSQRVPISRKKQSLHVKLGRSLNITHVVRRLRGGAQSFLVHCDDGLLYVLKMHANPQGPQVLANEALAAIILSGLGYSVPRWRLINVGIQELRNLDLTLSGPKHLYLPRCGLHYGSQFLCEAGSHLSEWIPPLHEDRVTNRSELIGVSLLDLWASHDDERQCVYRRISKSKLYDLFFIDNGHMFGGPSWSSWDGKRRGCPRLLGKPVSANDPALPGLIALFKTEIPKLLISGKTMIPEDWYQGTFDELFARLLIRLSNIELLVSEAEDFYHEQLALQARRRQLYNNECAARARELVSEAGF